MPYTPQTWADGSGGGTPITAARLAVVEAGIRVAALPAWVVDSAGDGTTNVTTIAQTAVDAAATAGGGLVVFGPGTHCVAGLVIKTGVHIRGAGHKATTLKLVNSSASGTDVIIGENFATLTGTSGTGGPYSWSISSLSIDGNVANNATGGRGVRVYGRDFVLRDMRVYNCASDGFYTEWGTGSPDAIGMESLWDNVKCHNNGGWGFNLQGPHDSFVDHCIAYDNAGGGFSATNNAHAILFRTCHSWGNQPIAVLLGQQSCEWVNGQAETVTAVSGNNICVKITSDSCKVLGGVVFNPDVSDTNTVGVQVGDGTHNVYATRVDTTINTCAAGAVKFVGNLGGGEYHLMVSQPIGTPIVGTPDASDVIDIPTLPGAASNSLGLNGEIVRSAVIGHYARHRGGLPDGPAQWVYLGRWSTYNGGQRIKIEINGTSGYDAVPNTVGRVVILASTGNSSPTPNIAGVFWVDGGYPVVTEVKAKRVGTDQLKWDIYAHVADYPGATHIEVDTGTGVNPASWTFAGTATTDPGAGSTTIAVFIHQASLDGVAITGTPTAGQVLTTSSATAATWANRADVQVFTGSGTWTKPAGVSTVTIVAIGGGGGGGSGAREATSTVASGGAGGGGGGFVERTVPASVLSSTETVTVGTGGAGGTAITANTTVGNNGVAGGNSSFKSTSFLIASGGALGGGGSTGAATGGNGGASAFSGGAGASSSATGLVGTDAVSTTAAAPGGGSGGGLTSGNAASSGGAGGTISAASGMAAGTAGTAGGAGGAGTAAATNSGLPGTSGGGGASALAAAAGTGGAGAIYGGGGGGGGGSRNGNNSGAGGAGANGIVIVVSV